jgi:hypothetical protein
MNPAFARASANRVVAGQCTVVTNKAVGFFNVSSRDFLSDDFFATASNPASPRRS